jgi:nucleoside-diphosphate-sugar epimerase
MKIVVIGGTGHIGTYLVPRLVRAGYDVSCVSRQLSKPYKTAPEWNAVAQFSIDRDQAEQDGTFGEQIKELGGEVVIDLISFTPRSTSMLVDALLGKVQHFVHCGTMWVHGHSELVPTLEKQKRKPICAYGTNKAKIESYLLSINSQKGFPATILHPGHITGPGWLPINPAGHLASEVFIKLAAGEEVLLPNFGMETLHHVHADDVAQAFQKALENRETSIGESFHVLSEQALTLRGFAEAVANWYGREAKLKFLPWVEWEKTVSKMDAQLTADHLLHSPNGSIEKARKLLNYQPAYSSLAAVREAVNDYFGSTAISTEI